MNESLLSKSFAALLFVATILLFLPTWFWLSDPYHSHGPLVILVALYLAWVQREAFTAVPPAKSSKVPQADTLLLMGGGLGGLATWLGCQWRKRRAR